MTWKIFLTPTAEHMLAGVADRRVREAVAKRIEQLSRDPEKQGKPLHGPLLGYRSVRAMGQRYRVIYRVVRHRVVVCVVSVGLRKEGDKADVYALAQKLVRLGLTGPPST